MKGRVGERGDRRVFDASRWPSAALVGLDLTSRRGASKLAERRTRGADNAGMALCAPVDAGWTVYYSLRSRRLCDTARVNVVDSTTNGGHAQRPVFSRQG